MRMIPSLVTSSRASFRSVHSAAKMHNSLDSKNKTSQHTAIVWFTGNSDLRITDHEPITQAVATQPTNLIPLYCLDNRLLRPTALTPHLGVCSTGPYRLKALLQAVESLRSDLESLGSGLLTTRGLTEHFITQITASIAKVSTSISLHYYQSITGGVEAEIESAVVSAFIKAATVSFSDSAKATSAVTVHGYVGATTYHPEDIAFISTTTITEKEEAFTTTKVDLRRDRFEEGVAKNMTEFRKKLQSTTVVRKPLPAPGSLPLFPRELLDAFCVSSPLFKSNKEEGSGVDLKALYTDAGGDDGVGALEGILGTLLPEDAFIYQPIDNTKVVVEYSEAAAQERLNHLLNPNNNPPIMANYKETRMMSQGIDDDSALLSWHLSLGTISPRTVFHNALQSLGSTDKDDHVWKEATEDDRGARWLLMHLGIRDYFLYTALKVGNDVLSSEGGPSQCTDTSWSTDISLFTAWARGQTGFPFIDANMRQIACTGTMSNRGRQNVANFLTKQLGIDWRLGAAWFECLLVDHDRSLNLGNWAYNSGVGFDPRNRKFLSVSQGEVYDPAGLSIRKWVPELIPLLLISSESTVGDVRLLHRPWERSDASFADVERSDLGYPEPMVAPENQISRGKKKKK